MNPVPTAAPLWGRGAVAWTRPPVLSLAPQLCQHPACPRLLLGAGDSGRFGRYHCLPACLAPCSPPPSALSFPRSLTEPPLQPTPHPRVVFQGWTYAIDFPATYTRDKKWNSCVRRRRWIRYRRYRSRDAWAKVCARAGPQGGAARPLLGGSPQRARAQPASWRPYTTGPGSGIGPLLEGSQQSGHCRAQSRDLACGHLSSRLEQ